MPDMDRRAILAIALSFLVLFGSNWLFQKLGWLPTPSNTQVATAPPDSASAPGQAQFTAPGAKTLTTLGARDTTGAHTGASGAWVATDLPDTVLMIDQPLFTARVRTRGARLLSVVLKQYKDGDDGRVALADTPALGLDLGDDATPVSLADTPYAWAESSDASGRVATLTLTARDSSGLSVVQTYRFGGEDYRIGYSVSIAGLNPALDLRRYRIAMRSWPLVTERTHGEDLANLGVTTKVGKDNRRHLATDLKKGPKANEGAIRWLAVHSKYFLLGLVPAEDVQGIGSRAALAPGTLPEAHDQVEGSVTIPLRSRVRSWRSTTQRRAGRRASWRRARSMPCVPTRWRSKIFRATSRRSPTSGSRRV